MENKNELLGEETVGKTLFCVRKGSYSISIDVAIFDKKGLNGGYALGVRGDFGLTTESLIEKKPDSCSRILYTVDEIDRLLTDYRLTKQALIDKIVYTRNGNCSDDPDLEKKNNVFVSIEEISKVINDFEVNEKLAKTLLDITNHNESVNILNDKKIALAKFIGWDVVFNSDPDDKDLIYITKDKENIAKRWSHRHSIEVTKAKIWDDIISNGIDDHNIDLGSWDTLKSAIDIIKDTSISDPNSESLIRKNDVLNMPITISFEDAFEIIINYINCK
jgi:hypothetical protein